MMMIEINHDIVFKYTQTILPFFVQFGGPDSREMSARFE